MICTALVAAPFRRLSATTHRWKVRGRSGSLRTRPTKTSLRPAISCGVGKPSGPPAIRIPGNTTSARRSESSVSSRSVSTVTCTLWPTSTGTRTQVAATGRSGSARILRVSPIILRSSPVQPSASKSPMCGTTFPAMRRGEGGPPTPAPRLPPPRPPPGGPRGARPRPPAPPRRAEFPRLQPLAGELAAQRLAPRLPRAADRLVGGGDPPHEPRRAPHRLQRHHHLDGGAVRVGDDPQWPVRRRGHVDLGDD